MITLLNPNEDSSGYSDDNFLQHELDMGASRALVRNSPKLVAINADPRVAIQSIYRAAGDGDFSDTPYNFVTVRHNAAPQATWIHLTNEAGLPPDIGEWSLTCAVVAEFYGKHVVAFNAATNTDVKLWQAQESAIKELTRRGHKIGVHLYLDGLHDDGGYAPLDYLKSIGADCFITEYGYIQSITNDGVGHRAVMDDLQYADWLQAHAAKLASYGWPAFLFSLDQWRNNDQGRAQGFGYEDRPHVIARCKVINQRYNTMPVYPIGTNPSSKRVSVPAGLNLRSTPNGTLIHTMPFHETVTVYASPRVTDVPPHPWLRVMEADGTLGWAADDQSPNGGSSFEDAPIPDTWTVQLDVPYVSQIDSASAASNNDCLIASLLMLIRFWFRQQGMITPNLPTVDDLVKYTPLAAHPPALGLTFADGIALAARLGFVATYVQPLTEQKIVDYLNAQTPVAVLMNYAIYNPASKPLAHILVVSGYNDADFLTQDPYSLGKNVAIERARLIQSISSSPGNSIGFQGLVLSV